MGIAIWIFFANKEENVVKVSEVIPIEQKRIDGPIALERKETSTEVLPEPVPAVKVSQSSLLENVPFTSQAPFGEWNDSTFQNGCEEAALVMAEYWLTGKVLTKDSAKKEIILLEKFEEKKFGQSIDASTKDTEQLFRDYYGVTTSEVRTDITPLDIQETLASGALVIVPADGRKLFNPNFKQPGPTTHMVVIIGYDKEKKEFITNDSGTRNGKNYRYKENILFSAIRDYPTGDHLPIKEIKKVMIVVKK